MRFIRYSVAFVWILAVCMGLQVVPAEAAEMSVTASTLTPYTGDEIVVDVRAHTLERVNAAGGTLRYPADKLTLTEVRDGRSVLHLWIEKSTATPGIITFSGLSTSGFTAPTNEIISFVFTATAAGEAPLVLTDGSLLGHNGEGTNVLTSVRGTTLTIAPGKDNTEQQVLIDTEAPEHFTPERIADAAIFEGEHALVFATQDKGSGISHYEVREGWFGRFATAESPYLLRDQSLQKQLFVRATDIRGNERTVRVPAVYPVPAYKYGLGVLVLLLVGIAILYVIKKVWRK